MFTRDVRRRLVRTIPRIRLIPHLPISGPTVHRRDDLLYLRFRFINLSVVKGTTKIPQLRRINAESPAYIVVLFQPQSIAEEAFFEDSSPPPPPPPPVRARIAGDSRLVFRLPDEVSSIDYTLESLLSWTQLEPSLAPNALPPTPTPADLSPRPRPKPLLFTETAIEFPFRIFLSPNRTAGWAHEIVPFTHEGRTELWHTRLGVLVDGEVDELEESTRKLRAIWSHDFNSSGPPPAKETRDPGNFTTTITPNQRHQVVRLTSDFGIWIGGFVLPGGVTSPYFTLDDISVVEDITPVLPPALRTRENINNRVTRRVTQLPENAITQPEQINRDLLRRIQAGDNIPIIAPSLVDDIVNERVQIDPNIRDIIVPILLYYNPLPLDVERFMLTSQGATAKFRGEWDVLSIPTSLDLFLDVSEWEHIATQGRDHFVRIVEVGYIYPFGHLAVKITITERKFEAPPGGDVGGYLRQRQFIVIKQKERTYAPGSFAHQGREMPFRQLIRFKTRVTPNLDAPVYIPDSGGSHWIEVEKKPFIFHLHARDIEDQIIDFHGGGIFVPHSVLGSGQADRFRKIRDAYAMHEAAASENDLGPTARRISVPNQRVAFAPRDPGKDGNTLLDTEGIYFLARETGNAPSFPFTPYLEVAEVRIPAADAVAGGQGLQSIQLFQKYLNSSQGLSAPDNPGGVFAELLNSKPVKFAAEQAGGLATPNLNMSGLSQHLGPIAGTLDDIASGSFDPVDFFNGMEAKLLGGIDLFEIIQAAVGAGFDAQIPKLNVKPIPAPPAIPERIEASLKWQPAVQPFGPFEPTNNTDLTIDVLLTQYVSDSPPPPSSRIEGVLTNFDINFADIITITFDELRFVKEDNKKLDVHVDIPDDGIKFGGPLKFLNELEKYLDPASFADPPVLDISPSGVTVGYTLMLPPLAVGVLTLKDVGLGAALSLPFGGGPEDKMRVRFNLSERQAPFNLAVMIFAGGGFFAISLGADGLEVLEIALEFGGSASLDIGVASGGISVMAGFYFKLERNPDRIELTAYIRLNGYLSVLGIINISVEFYLELSYKEFPGGKSKLTGRATVTVKVEVLFFSASVKMTVERKFSGNADDPTFSEMLEPGDWFEYGEAFA